MLSNFSYVLEGELAGCAHPDSYGACSESLQQLREEGIGAIVSLDEDGLPAYMVAEHGFTHLHLPVPDFNPPTLQQAEQFVSFVRGQAAAQVPVVAHCRGGYGRTGTMLAAYLVSLGETAESAIDEVRELRPGSIETREQERFVKTFENYLRATEPDLDRRRHRRRNA